MPAARVPFSLVEEITGRHDRAPNPMTMHAEFRLSGRLDPDRLRLALGRALAAHPMTRARMVAGRRLLRPPLWEVAERVEADCLDTLRYEDESALDAARLALINRPIDLRHAPALRVLLAQGPDGDSLLAVGSHVMCDGLGLNRFVHSVARAYAGRPDPLPDADPIAVRDLRTLFRLSDVAKHRAPTRPNTLEGPLEFLAADPSPAPDRPGYGLARLDLPDAQRRTLNPRRFGPASSWNDLLLVGLHLAIAAWNAHHGATPGRIAVFMPLSLRPIDWFNQVVANLTLGGNTTSTPDQRAEVPRLAASVLDQTQWMKAGGGLSKLLETRDLVYKNLPVLLPLIFRFLGDRGKHSAVLTYFGKVDGTLPDFGPEAGEVLDAWGSPPVVDPPGLAIAASLYRGRLIASFRYRRSRLGDEAAARFARLYLETLLALGAPAEPPREIDPEPPTTLLSPASPSTAHP
jgi:NRPS condensation-like uncharacterized protein